MTELELIELYPSPYSERVRWVLETKRVPYRRTPYVPLAGEEDHKRRTGIATAPVLIADGEVIGDSDVAVDWLEARHPSPALVPDNARRRAQVRAWELFATEALAPLGRIVAIGRYKQMNLQPLADHFAAKYTTGARRRAHAAIESCVPSCPSWPRPWQSRRISSVTSSRAPISRSPRC